MTRRTLRQLASGTVVFVVVAVSSVGIASAATPSLDRLCVNLTTAQCDKYKSDLSGYAIAFANWKTSIRSIDAAHQSALVQARAEKLKSFADADALPARARATQRLAAMRKYVAAVRTANTAHSTAMQTLGPAPKRPARPKS